MKKLILCILFLITLSIVNANTIDLEYNILKNKVVVIGEYNFDNDFELKLPDDAEGISLYRNGNLIEVGDNILIESGEDIKLSYVTKDFLEKNKYFLVEIKHPYDFDLKVNLVFPEGASLVKSVNEGLSAYPSPDNIKSDGKSIILEWDKDVKADEGFSIFVNYDMPINSLYFIILIIVLVLVVVGLFILLKKKKIKIVEKVIKKTITRRKDDVEKHLKEDEKILINILKQKDGSCEQGTLVIVSDFSKAKVSALLVELEHRKVIKKINKGKKNIVMLNKAI